MFDLIPVEKDAEVSRHFCRRHGTVTFIVNILEGLKLS